MSARAYYNEIDPAAAQWLRNLIAAGHIAPGDVDTRSIEDVTPNDLRGYTQCHFFAGISGWSLALRLAGWPDDRRVWTGSCPCQPFSAAGRGDGFADQRHLWPAWFHLIKECRPEHVFGEQVAAAVGHQWLDLVQADMEGQGYRVGAAVLGAHSVGAPHIRQRLWFVADAECGASERHGHEMAGAPRSVRETARKQRIRPDSGNGCAVGELADADSSTGGQGSAQHGGRNQGSHAEPGRGLSGDGVSGELGHAIGPRLEGLAGHGDHGDEPGRQRAQPDGSTATAGFWSACDWLPCRDGKARPVEPGSFPLAHGIPARVVRLRAYGNSIVPQVAAEFIGAYLDVRGVA